MRQYLFIIPLLGCLLAGCSTVAVIKDVNGQQLTTGGETTIAHLNGNNYGYYLFGWIPLIAGDTSKTNSWVLFKDTVTEEAVVQMVTRTSKELGATKTTDLVSRFDSTGLRTLFIFWYFNVQVSANAVK
jgi:hypothetical protein